MVCHEEEAISGEAKKAWVSLPCLGKHICFDGRYLHGAPAELALGNKPSDTNSVSERCVVDECIPSVPAEFESGCCESAVSRASCNAVSFRIVIVSVLIGFRC